MKKKIMLLSFVTFFLFCLNVKAVGYTYRVKIINSGVNLRNNPGGNDGVRVGLLSRNDYYILVDDKLYDDENNHKRCNGGWYHMTYYTDVEGYVCSDDVKLVKSYSSDDIEASTDCEKELASLGFPSSYWGGICSIKEDHPTWNFQPIKINYNWVDVVDKESVCGRNYIHLSVYDKEFLDKTCTSTSPGGYVAPSQKAVAYYMDPRNAFSEKYLFQFLDQSYDASLEKSYPNAVESILNGTSFNDYHINTGVSLRDVILAKSVNKVSPIAIASKMRVELGTGTNLYNLYSGTYAEQNGIYLGYYNFFNFGVTDSCVAESGTSVCGLSYAYRAGWKGVDNAVEGGIVQFSSGYILKNQYTGYLQKFNVLVNDFDKLGTHQYMTNLAGAMSESNTAFNSYSKNNLLGIALNFKIPVYNNMGDTINNSANGAVDDGDNSTKPSDMDIPTIITGSKLKSLSDYIYGFTVGSDVATVKGIIEGVAGNNTVVIYDSSDNEISSGLIATGQKIKISNKTTSQTFTVVVKGDTSGDGVINALDLLQVQKNILDTYNLTGAYKEAGDTSGDGVINALDLLQVQKSILGTYTIDQ